MLDKNCDGILTLNEIKEGYAQAFHPDDPEAVTEAEVQEIFSYLDLDGSGRITYTEFCAAGLGEDGFADEHILWSAFKTFDIHDDGKISKEELRQVLQRADITQVWTSGVCEEVAEEVVQIFGSSEESINFDEWLSLMRECSARHNEVSPRRFSQSLQSLLGENQSGFVLDVGNGCAPSTQEPKVEAHPEKAGEGEPLINGGPADFPAFHPAPIAIRGIPDPVVVGGHDDLVCCGSGLQRIYRSLSSRRFSTR
ncbi:unnamed protein product [Durusdinium trenchii]|uniref:EF-hand domain-containing protein n=1 Tax=Durusdinium trenchii TaxID=1381693 RepID=A0ABP0PFX2_9DINO